MQKDSQIIGVSAQPRDAIDVVDKIASSESVALVLALFVCLGLGWLFWLERQRSAKVSDEQRNLLVKSIQTTGESITALKTLSETIKDTEEQLGGLKGQIDCLQKDIQIFQTRMELIVNSRENKG